MSESNDSKNRDDISRVPKQSDRGFTLIELLVVMATTALLAVVVLPAMAKSGDGGARAVCANNMRQLGIALNLYAAENQDYLPWPNWGFSGTPPGWLYGPQGCNSPTNLQTGSALTDANNWSLGRVANLKTGVYWQYLPNADAFYCPVDALSVGTFQWSQRSQKLSSYVMNGAAAYYPGGNPAVYGYRTCKRTDVWSPLCYIQWEPNPANTFTYNDGANYPDLTEGIGPMHYNGGNALAIAGNVDLIELADFQKLEYPQNLLKGPKTLFHWNPMLGSGTGPGEPLP